MGAMIVAEIGQTHEGSLGNALAFIDALADVGVDAVKFQDHFGDKNDEWRAGVDHPQEEFRSQYWQRTTFYPHEWALIRLQAMRRGVKYGVSCFSDGAAWRQEVLRPDFWKIAAESNAQLPIPEPRIGLSVWSWLPDESFDMEGDNGNDTHWDIVTTRQYPTPCEDVPLDKVDGLKCVGLSCHCPEIGPGIEAAKRGAKYIEYHACWDRRQFGPDVSSSLTIDEFAELVKEVRKCESQ